MQQVRNLQKVVKYIEVHIMEPIHLSDAAAETGVSSAYLSTMFKKEMGYNFIEYVNLRKIELARQMLQDGKWSMNLRTSWIRKQHLFLQSV